MAQGQTSTDYWGMPTTATPAPTLTFPTGDATSPNLGPGKLKTDDIIRQLFSHATTNSSLSTDLLKQGQDVLAPATDYLRAILSGDRQEALSATMPERRRVIDQYSAAKKALAEFAPRSGGTAGATSKLQGQESSDLAGILPQARQNALGTATQLGGGLQGLGLSAEQLASGDLGAVLQGLQNKPGVDWAKIGESVGMAVANYYTFGGASAAKALAT